MSDAMAIDISCASYAAPVFLPYQPEARSGTWRIRQQLPLTQEWLRKCRRRSSSRSSACRQARDEQGWTAFALCWGEVRGQGVLWVPGKHLGSHRDATFTHDSVFAVKDCVNVNHRHALC